MSAKANNALYRVKNWDDNFEGAKSRTYNNKTHCSMPTKHGLGYKKLVRQKNGAAMFGAWCALIQVLSRHPKERLGYCTEDGSEDGRPLTCEDLELLTDIPAGVFAQMFEVTAGAIGWVSVEREELSRIPQETTGIPRETGGKPQVYSNSDSNLDLDSNSDTVVSCSEPDKPTAEPPVLEIPIKGGSMYGITARMLDEWSEAYGAFDVMQELKKARQWCLASPSRQKTRQGVVKFLVGWLNRAHDRGAVTQQPRRGFAIGQIHHELNKPNPLKLALEEEI